MSDTGDMEMYDENISLKDSEDLSILNIIVKKYNDFAKGKLSGYNFTPNEISTMVYLLEDNDIDTAKGISTKYGVTQSLICRSVDSLTKRGIITVKNDSADRRVNHLDINITDEKLLNILTNLNSMYIEKMFEGVDPEDVAVFRRVLGQIDRNIR